MKAVFEQLAAHIDQGAPCMLVSAVGAEGSAPRKTRSHMLVDAHGRVCGTVGGGAVEGRSILHAQRLLCQCASDLKTFELYEHAGDDIGMICGGRVNVHFQYVSSDDSNIRLIAAAAVSAFAAGRDAWLIISLSSHTLAFHEKERCIADVPAGILDCLGPDANTAELDGHAYYIEQLVYSDRVYIFGGGHVAQALVPVLSAVDFRCVIIEDRAEFCRKELFEQAQDVLLLEEKDWVNSLHIGQRDCICIMTRGHKNDLACQAYALSTQAGYIGVIGSRRKIAYVQDQLRNLGYDDAQIARIVTPIGLEIGAVTPAEIAVSIAAQMIAHRAHSRTEPIEKSCMA